MSPELSRRAACAVNMANTPLQDRLRLAEAVDAAETFEDLPDWARKIITDAEAGRSGQPANADPTKPRQ